MTEIEHSPIYGYDVFIATDSLQRTEYVPRFIIGSFKTKWPSLRFWGRLTSRHFYTKKDAIDYAEKYFLHHREFKPWEYVGNLSDVHGEDLIKAFYGAKVAQAKPYKCPYSGGTQLLYTIAKKG